ncbi:MAG: hypothetical protein ACREBC_24315, partial [Pyrinomonadaceae bacterium]
HPSGSDSRVTRFAADSVFLASGRKLANLAFSVRLLVDSVSLWLCSNYFTTETQGAQRYREEV